MPRHPRLNYLVYLFDADGPLINSVEAAFGTTNRVLESMDLPPLGMDTWRQKTRSPRNLYRDAGVPADMVDEAIARYPIFFEELKHTATSLLEVEETLHALSDKRVGVVTDMPRSEWEGYESRFPFLRDYPSTV
ncbi:MAG: HAD hydrolase-like protein, partial [Candidatus Aenigmarchaeota archaeon]|nr:HAD hydrolase-like protein [Candidatus Aenigmarchaeota archaeon]